MEGLRRGLLLAATALLFAAVMLPEVAAVRYLVGSGSGGWMQGVNFTTWAQDKKFYKGDWLYFVYDRTQVNILEVNKTNYENCISDHPLHNWTTGAGRDVVPLNVTRTYYFISGNGFCYGGMKIAVHVLNPPPTESTSALNSSFAPSLPSTFRSRIFVPALFAVAAVWDSMLLLL